MQHTHIKEPERKDFSTHRAKMDEINYCLDGLKLPRVQLTSLQKLALFLKSAENCFAVRSSDGLLPVKKKK